MAGTMRMEPGKAGGLGHAGATLRQAAGPGAPALATACTAREPEQAAAHAPLAGISISYLV